MQNLHTHTTYCDGAQSAEAMIDAAIAKGCASIGFSEHSHVWFVEKKYSMSPGTTRKYIAEISALKEKYADRIEIYLGIELDYCTDHIPDGLDYIIGSVHNVQKGYEFVTADHNVKEQQWLIDKHYGGDYIAFAEAYYATVAGVAKKTKADIIGHFDVMAKNNINGCLFDEMNPKYVSAALGAMDEILKDCRLFEVNTGAMHRINKPDPYPSPFLLKELRKRGGEVILSSDSHAVSSLCYKFNEMRELLIACGYKCIKRLTKNGFIDVLL